MIKPKFKHDCDACVFVGRLDGRDCYIHTAPTGQTLIARYGNDGPDYLSTPAEMAYMYHTWGANIILRMGDR